MTPLFPIAALAAALAAAAPPSTELERAADRAAEELAAALARAPGRAQVRGLAVLEFAAAGPAAAQAPALADRIAARLGELAGLPVMDRAKVAAVVGEQKLQAMTGRGASELEVARLLADRAVLSGRVTDAGDRLDLEARLADAAGKVLAAARQAAPLPRAERPREERRAPAESASIEVAMRRLADGLAGGFAKLPGSARYRRLAVLAFDEAGDEVKRRRLGTAVTAEIVTGLRRDHGLLLVERERLAQVLGELKLQAMAGVGPAAAGRIGELSDAQALVLGSVSEAGDRFLVSARIVATESGETLAADSTAVAAAGLVALASDAVVLRSRSGAVFRSALLPGFGQFYNRQPAKGWLFLGGEAALLGGALGFHLSGAQAFSAYRDRTSRGDLGAAPAAEAARLYDVGADRYRVRNGLLLAAAGLWAVNVADAFLSGVDGEALLGGGSLAALPTPGGAMAQATLRF